MYELLYYMFVLLMCLSLKESRSRELPANMPLKDKEPICEVQVSGAIWRNEKVKTRQAQPRTITLEVGLFIDSRMRDKFNQNEADLENYIKTLMRGAQLVFNYPTLWNHVNLQVNKYEIVPSDEVIRERNSVIYLTNFCRWHWAKYGNNMNYDLAMFFVKSNMYSAYNPNNIIEGLARSESVCYPNERENTCLMANISYLDSMWVIAHEIMHTFGVPHIPRDNTETDGVMHPINGNPFHWTNCTNRAFEAYLSSSNSLCLFNSVGHPIQDWDLNKRPFHNYTMDDQCALNFGQMYKNYEFYSDSCNRLVCKYDLFNNIHTNSPLELTKCGKDTIGWGKCVGGKCLIQANG